jgi:hypothetical protein
MSMSAATWPPWPYSSYGSSLVFWSIRSTFCTRSATFSQYARRKATNHTSKCFRSTSNRGAMRWGGSLNEWHPARPWYAARRTRYPTHARHGILCPTRHLIANMEILGRVDEFAESESEVRRLVPKHSKVLRVPSAASTSAGGMHDGRPALLGTTAGPRNRPHALRHARAFALRVRVRSACRSVAAAEKPTEKPTTCSRLGALRLGRGQGRRGDHSHAGLAQSRMRAPQHTDQRVFVDGLP